MVPDQVLSSHSGALLLHTLELMIPSSVRSQGPGPSSPTESCLIVLITIISRIVSARWLGSSFLISTHFKGPHVVSGCHRC